MCTPLDSLCSFRKCAIWLTQVIRNQFTVCLNLLVPVMDNCGAMQLLLSANSRVYLSHYFIQIFLHIFVRFLHFPSPSFNFEYFSRLFLHLFSKSAIPFNKDYYQYRYSNKSKQIKLTSLNSPKKLHAVLVNESGLLA